MTHKYKPSRGNIDYKVLTPNERVTKLFTHGQPTAEQIAKAILDAEYDTISYPDLIRSRHGGIN